MGPLQAHTEIRFTRPAELADMLEMTSRHEPQLLVERIVPKDPYAAWLEQREAERELEDRPMIRWVHRHPGGDRGGIVARRL